MSWNNEQLKLAAQFFNNLAVLAFAYAIFLPLLTSEARSHYFLIMVGGAIIAVVLHGVGQFILRDRA